MARHPAITACAAIVWVCGLASLNGCGDVSEMTLAPISTAGSVQTTALTRRSTDGTTEHTLLQSGSVAVDSYVWQPWFIRTNGDLSIAYDQTFGGDDGASLRSSAGATIQVLPLSKYPVTVNLAHTDSRVSGEFGGSDFIRDRASVNARAAFTQNLNAGLTASWDRTDREDSGILNTQNVSLDATHTFSKESAFLGITSVGAGASFRMSTFEADDPTDEDTDHQTAILRLNMRSEPFTDVVYDSLYTFVFDDLVEDDDTFRRLALQGISTVQWRPKNEPYIVTGSLRTLSEQIDEQDNGNDQDSSTLLASGRLGLRWPIHDRLSFNAGVRGSYEDVKRDEGADLGESDLDEGQRIDASLLAGANYRSETSKLGGFDWYWDARAQTENGLRHEEGMFTRDSVTLGHRFERQLDFAPIDFAFAQELDLSAETLTDEPFTVGVSNSANFGYSTSTDTTTTFARLFLRDSRDFVGETREFQTVQFRAGRQVAISRDRRLQGNVDAQAIRQVDQGETDISITASGNISYQHRNFLDVENLGFRSELRVNVVDIDTALGLDDEDVDPDLLRNDWRNILSYRIGRLTAELEATAFHRDAAFGYLGLMRLRRDFGGVQ